MSESFKKNLNIAFSVAVILCVIAAFASTAYKFLYTKNYYFVVEAQCNPQEQVCYYRDCSLNDGTCPPNDLSIYSRFRIKAYDFNKCTDNSCSEQCKDGTISCTPIPCDPSTDSCTKYPVD